MRFYENRHEKNDMPFLLFFKNGQNLKLSSAANYRRRFMS